MRCFVGFFPPEDLKDEIVELQRLIGKLPIRCKMVERKNLHVNLAFLGEVENEKSLIEKLDESILGLKQFEVRLDELRVVPMKRPRVMFITVKDSGEMKSLSSAIVKSTGGNFKEHHVTLCRIKTVEDRKGFNDGMADLPTCSESFVVGKISLIKSILTSSGPVYENVKQWSLTS